MRLNLEFPAFPRFGELHCFSSHRIPSVDLDQPAHFPSNVIRLIARVIRSCGRPALKILKDSWERQKETLVGMTTPDSTEVSRN